MTPQIGLVIMIASLLISVFVSPKLKGMNIGITAMLFAFLIGYWFCGLGSGAILGYFPTMLVLTTILSTFMFGYVARVGVSQGVADRIMWIFRNHTNLVPFALLIATYAIGALGAGAFATPVLMSPIAFELAAVVGFDPVLSVLAIVIGSGAASNLPWLGAPLPRQYIPELFGEQYVNQGIWGVHNMLLPAMLIVFVVIYIITGAWKKKTTDVASQIKKPDPFNAEQKKVLYLLLVYIILIAVPPIINAFAPNAVAGFLATKLDFWPLTVIAILVLNMMNIAEIGDVVKNDIAWGAALMLGGTGMLIKLLEPLGVITWLSDAIANSIPQSWAVPAIVIVAGLISLFINGAVGIQTLAPIVSAVAAKFPAISGVGAYCALQSSVGVVSMSPFSTGGALAMTGCRDEKVRETVTRKLIVVAIVTLLLHMLLAKLGMFETIKM